MHVNSGTLQQTRTDYLLEDVQKFACRVCLKLGAITTTASSLVHTLQYTLCGFGNWLKPNFEFGVFFHAL